MRIKTKKKQLQNYELELQETIQQKEPESEFAEELEEELPDPIEIPDIFPEEFLEDMETDVPDAPEPELKKQNIFTKILNFFRKNSYEKDDESENISQEFIENFSEDVLEDDLEKLSEVTPEYESEKLSENISQEFIENFSEDILEDDLDELPEIIPEDDLEELIEPQEIQQQTTFPKLDESALEITPDLELPDLEDMDEVSDLLNLMELDELEEEDNSEELIDAPELMPDDLSANFNSDSIILNPEANSSGDELTAPEFKSKFKSKSKSKSDSEAVAEKPKRHIGSRLIAIAFVLIFVAVFVICFQNGVFDEKEVYYMPDLVGLDYYNLENEFDLDIQVEESDYSAYEKDKIYEQDIPVGEVIELGQTVHVNISLGLAMQIIPDVRNYQLAYAQKMLEQAGFKTAIQYEMSLGGTKVGNVIRTEPEINEEIAIGTVVTMFISQGTDNTVATVPNVVGMSLDKAITLCEESGLTVDAIPVPSLEAENTVISQDLEVNTQVNFGTVIVLNYSNAEAPTGEVSYQLDLPAYANGRFTLDFVNQDGTVVATSTLIAGFSAGSAIPVESYGAQQIRVILTNDANAKQAEIGIYDFDFTTGIYTVITEDVQNAFASVNGIG